LADAAADTPPNKPLKLTAAGIISARGRARLNRVRLTRGRS